MTPRELIDFTTMIGKLKTTTRHCYTEEGRLESVADHSWRITLMAMLCKDEFPQIDICKVMQMCLIHDFGEAVTGDIPAFDKTDAHEDIEEKAIAKLLKQLPPNTKAELTALFDEMEALESPEAKLWKSLDNMEAVMSHNESELSTWLPLEYDLNLTYGEENVKWSEWTKELKAEINKDTLKKLSSEQK